MALGQQTRPIDGTGDIGIAFAGVRKGFGEVLDPQEVTFEIQRHSRFGIVGPSGGFKSTLLQLTAGLLDPDEGVVDVEGEATAKGRLGRCAMMPQRDLLLPWRTTLDNAVIALEKHGLSRSEARETTRPYFEHFGLAQFEDVRPAQLSGGMRQRVSPSVMIPRQSRPISVRAFRELNQHLSKGGQVDEGDRTGHAARTCVRVDEPDVRAARSIDGFCDVVDLER